MSFSEASQSSSIKQESRQLATFQEESTESCGFTQTKNSAMKSSSTMNQSSSSSFQSSSRAQVESSNQSSSMSMSSSKTMTSSSTSSSSFQSGFTKQVGGNNIGSQYRYKSVLIGFTDVFIFSLTFLSRFQNCNFQENQISNVESKLIENQQQEIQQDNLKTQIVSAITDLEGDREFVDFGKENKTIELLTSPEQKLSPPRVTSFTPTKQVNGGVSQALYLLIV